MAKKKIEEQKITKERRTNFQLYDKAVSEIYGSERGLNYRTEHTTTNRRLFNLKTKAELQTLLSTSLDNAEQIIQISQTLHGVDPNYMKIISYYSDMFLIRYSITPVLIDKAIEIQSEEYLKLYNDMVGVVDGLNLETLVPDLLKELFITGSVYMYATKQNAAKTVSVTILPANYCRTVLKTNFGTNLIEFNFEYFDNFDDEDLDRVLKLFPKEFTGLYRAYESDNDLNWQPLNPKFSTSILANEKGLPPLISSLAGIVEYDYTRQNELDKGENQLKKILIHQIPVEDGEPIFDLEEVKSIQKAINLVTARHEGLETITVFGNTELHSLQEEGKTENKRIIQAYDSIFNTAGLNANLFSSKTDMSLKLSMSIDKAMVWNFIKQINSFVNLTINNLYKFKPLQTEIKLLPITIFDEQEQVKSYRENAAFGLGKIDAVVASGVKQKTLTDEFRLEQEIGLENLLKPLQSSHTNSGTITTNEVTAGANPAKEEVEEEEVNEDE